MSKTVESKALELLRGCLDLAVVDLRPTPDLMGRLMALDAEEVRRLVEQLRNAGLLQPDELAGAHARLAMTMEGLAIAAGLPSYEPTPARARPPVCLAA